MSPVRWRPVGVESHVCGQSYLVAERLENEKATNESRGLIYATPSCVVCLYQGGARERGNEKKDRPTHRQTVWEFANESLLVLRTGGDLKVVSLDKEKIKKEKKNKCNTRTWRVSGEREERRNAYCTDACLETVHNLRARNVYLQECLISRWPSCLRS